MWLFYIIYMILYFIQKLKRKKKAGISSSLLEFPSNGGKLLTLFQ